MERMKEVSRVGFFGILGNIFLMCIKMITGLLFSSQAMIADAVNSLMDIFASFMTMMGGKIGSRPRDHDHQFGHGKAEFLFSLFVSLSMMGGALFILIDSFQGLLSSRESTFSYYLVFAGVLTIFIKLVLYFYSKRIYQSTKSLLVYSNMLDHRNDVIVTSFTLLSILFTAFHINWFDSMVGIGISIWIGISGFQIFLDSYRILMDQAMDEDVTNKIRSFVLEQDGVEGITKFETAPTGYQYILILSILVDGNMSTFESHEIADRLEHDILNSFPDILMVTIHVNPTKVGEKIESSSFEQSMTLAKK